MHGRRLAIPAICVAVIWRGNATSRESCALPWPCDLRSSPYAGNAHGVDRAIVLVGVLDMTAARRVGSDGTSHAYISASAHQRGTPTAQASNTTCHSKA
jgi:hypothetical protein